MATDIVYNIGESTLETLPGTTTPPSALYSPKEKLTAECISVTSTPKNAVHCELAITTELQGLIVKFKSGEKRRKKVCFEDQAGGPDGASRGHELSIGEMKRRRRKHCRVLKSRKVLWSNYQRVKLESLKRATSKLALSRKGVRITRKLNPGDLLGI